MKVNTTRRNVFAGLALAAVLGTTGCSAINPQATTFEYAPSDGTQITINADESYLDGMVDFVNIAVITQDANDVGRLIGSIHNKSDSSQNVELEVNNNSEQFNIAAGEVLNLEDEEIVFEPVGSEPGALADGTATAFGVSEDFPVAILSPVLEHYRDLYPGDLDIEEEAEHLYDFQGQYHRDE